MAIVNDQEIWIRSDTLLTPGQRRTDCLLRIESGKIRQILSPGEMPGIPPGRLVHEPGAIVAPGFIDLHIHGAGGRDLMDGTRESLGTVAGILARHGTTSFLATTLSAPDSDTETALRGFRTHRPFVGEGAEPLGLHLEGPFLNPLRRGTHKAAYLRQTDLSAFHRFIDASGESIRRITVAPEMDPDFQVIRAACERGIQISLGHSDASWEIARAAADAGASQATHTFNAMRPLHQREPGILGMVLTDPRIYAEVIADGIHVHPAAVRLLWLSKGSERVMLITDGLSAVDMPDGSYPLGDKTILLHGGECRDPDGTLAGSTLTLDRAVQNLVNCLGVPLEQALAMASSTPASSLGLAHRKGRIVPGADADLVFLDEDLAVRRTMVAGRTVYMHP